MIFGIVTFFHVIASLVLIAVILLQSGRGGGLSEMAGGQGVQQTQKLFGTQTNSLLMKLTSYCAITFLITSITLVMMTSHRSRSLMESARIKPIFNGETADGKVMDKKQLEEAIKALSEAAKDAKAAAPAVKDAAQQTATATVKAVATVEDKAVKAADTAAAAVKTTAASVVPADAPKK